MLKPHKLNNGTKQLLSLTLLNYNNSLNYINSFNSQSLVKQILEHYIYGRQQYSKDAQDEQTNAR